MSDGLHFARGAIVLCVAIPLLAACGPRAAPGDSAGSAGDNAAYREMLVEKARELAEAEIARFAATELVFRNKTERQEFVLPVVGSRTGTFIKLYREFTGYELVDLRRADSLLYPIEIVIRYEFSVFGTQPRSLGTPDAESLTDNDHEYDVLWQGDYTHTYQCDRQGAVLGSLPEFPRANFYERDISPGTGGAKEPAVIPTVQAPERPGVRR